MVKHRARPPMGSLNSMASNIRNQKATSTNKLSGTGASLASQAKKFSDDDSESGSDTSSEDSDGSSSDSGSDLEAAKKKLLAKQASKKKDAKPNAKPTNPTSTNAKAPSEPTPTAKAANADASDSDSDSSDSGDAPAKGAAVKEADKAESSSESESDSESSEESDSEDETTGAQAKAPKPAEPESSSDDSSDEESDDDEPQAMDVDTNDAAVSRVNGNTAVEETNTQVSRPAWLDNSNFVLRKASSDNPGKEVTDFFNKTNLEGKQVWYFTAPASLPITVLKDMEIDLSKATTGEALLNHKGDNYSLDIESHATSTQIQLLIPSQGGDKYSALNRGIDSTVHIRRKATFGPNGATSATATDDYTPIPKAIRDQPQGLRPRFTPIGVPNPALPQIQLPKPQSTPAQDDSSESESESESDEEVAAPKPKKPEVTNGNLKRKHPGGEKAASKRPKTTTTISNKVSSVAPAFQVNGTAAKVQTPAKKEKKKDKYPVSATKQTPVPVPTIPSMKR
ncbi:uncharacterized protein F4822DRAFT_432672 [Hypoxylon trugodes]|uniref:uncharacterized protein n=1 Tax=Hypoxylon trugodes TaxID=326681 RepID=UPI00218DCA7A|nr:uncharacterized protein F4822DRAFT_432672 [Hypoxylon trugodes]KAI1385813.1 hypothetical protein F4822DRAFT_432672 [Hypoxylon trugodes]